MKQYKSTIPRYSLKKTSSPDLMKCKITNSSDANNYVRQFYHDDIEIFESVFILLLNKAGNTIGWAKISQGGIDAVLVDVKLICKYAIDSLASGLIMVHNHPSGNVMSSIRDNELANKIKNALNVIDVNLLDNLIIGPEEGVYLSYADEGIL